MSDQTQTGGRRPVQISLSPAWTHELQRLAERRGMNRSAFVRELIRQELIEERRADQLSQNPSAVVVVRFSDRLYDVSVMGREFQLERLGDQNPLRPLNSQDRERLVIQGDVIWFRPSGARYLMTFGVVEANDMIWLRDRAIIAASQIEQGDFIDVQVED